MKTTLLKSLIGSVLGLLICNMLGAVTGAPYVPVRFDGKAEYSGPGTATVSFALLDDAGSTVQIIGESSSVPGWFAPSAPGIAWMEPNKHYRFRIYANNIRAFELNFQAPDGYDVEYEGQLRSSKTWSGITWSPFQTEVVFRLVSQASRAPRYPGADSDLGDGRIFWEAALGAMPDGSSAGSLKVVDNQVHGFNAATVLSPAGLDFSAIHMTYNWQFIPDGVTLVRNPGGVSSPEVPLAIRQVYAPQVVVDVITHTTESYELRFYRREQATDTGSGNVPRFTFTGEHPYLVYKVEREGPPSPTLNGMKLTRSTYAATGGTPLSETISTVTYANTGVWTTTGRHTSALTPTTVEETTVSTVGSTTTQTTKVKPGGSSTVVLQKERDLEAETFGDIPSSVLLGTGATALETVYNYSTDLVNDPANWGLVNGRQFVGNQWERIGRDQKTGKVVARYRPWGNAPIFMNGDGNLGDTESLTYSNNAFGEAARPATGERKINATAVSSFGVTYTDSTVNGKAVVTADRWDYSFDGKRLESETSFYREDVTDYFFRLKIHSQVRPNGTKASYVYERGTLSGSTFTPSTSGPASRVVVIEGADANPGMSATQLTTYGSYDIDDIYVVPGRSTKRVILRDSMARIVRQESHVYGSSGWALLDAENLTYDYAHRLESRTTASNGLSVDYTYTNRGEVHTVTDAEGQMTSYTYDDAGRVATLTKSARAATTGIPAVPELRTAYTYNAAGLVTEIRTGPVGQENLVVSRVYDDAGRVTSETTPDTGTTTISYVLNSGSDGSAVTKTFANSTTETVTHFKDGKPKEVTGTAVVPEYYSYSVSGSWLQATTHVGTAASPRWTETRHDWFGRPVRTAQPGFASGGLSNPSFVTTRTYENNTGFLTKTTATGYADTLYTYDGLGALQESGLDIDGSGTLLAATTDRIQGTEIGFVNTAVNGSATRWWWRTSPWRYGTNGQLNATKVYLGESHQAVSGLGTDIASIIYSENTNGAFTTQTVSVDSVNKLTTITIDGDGTTAATNKSYGGLTLQSTTPDGRSNTMTYDALRRPSVSADSRIGSTTYAYHNGKTLLASATEPSTGVTTYAYDSLGRPTLVTDALGRTTRSSYTNRGQLDYVWGSGTYPIAYGYDATYGDRTSMTTYRGGSGWDGTSWPSDTTGTGDITTWVNDAATGLLYQKKDAANQAVSYLYNSSNLLSKRTWARGVTTDYSYSGLGTGELTVVNYSDSTPDLTYTYDRRGWVATVADYTGTRTFTYCECGKLTHEAHGTVLHNTWGLTYHLDTVNGANNAKGRTTGYTLKEGAATRHSLTYGYDTAGRLNNITTGGLIGTHSFDYAYLAGSSLVSSLTVNAPIATDPFVFSRTWESDRDAVDVAQTTWDGTTVASYTYAYDAAHQRTSVIQGGSAFADYGTSDTFTHRRFGYNTRGELTSDIAYGNGTVSGGGTGDLPGRRFEFAYDSLGNRTSSNRTGVAGLEDTYTTNNLNQYTQRENDTMAVSGTVANTTTSVVVRPSGGSYQLAGRQAGYWAHEVTPANASGPVKQTVDVVAADPGAGSGGADLVSTESATTTVAAALQIKTYDLDGNLTDDGVWTYTWDAENRLIAMQTTSTAAGLGVDNRRHEFYYDYMNRRVRKKTHTYNNITLVWDVDADSRFLYEGWNVIHEEDVVAARERTYAWGLDLVNSLSASAGVGALMGIHDNHGTDPDKTYLAGYDGNGNLTTLTNQADGTLVAAYEYGPFGESIRAEGAYAKDNPFRFSTKYTDNETDLVYYGMRYYDPKDGRFVGRDPIEEQGGINLYAFVINSPLNRWDYLGMDPPETTYTLVPDFNIGFEPSAKWGIFSVGFNYHGSYAETRVTEQGIGQFGEVHEGTIGITTDVTDTVTFNVLTADVEIFVYETPTDPGTHVDVSIDEDAISFSVNTPLGENATLSGEFDLDDGVSGTLSFGAGITANFGLTVTRTNDHNQDGAGPPGSSGLETSGDVIIMDPFEIESSSSAGPDTSDTGFNFGDLRSSSAGPAGAVHSRGGIRGTWAESLTDPAKISEALAIHASDPLEFAKTSAVIFNKKNRR